MLPPLDYHVVRASRTGVAQLEVWATCCIDFSMLALDAFLDWRLQSGHNRWPTQPKEASFINV